jgi:hypothetical protein
VVKDEDVAQKGMLINAINKVYENKEKYAENMKMSELKYTSAEQLYEEIVNG